MSRVVVRMTEAQLYMVLACMSYVNAGEASGTPLGGDTDGDAKERRNFALWDRAYRALLEAKRS